MNITNYFNIKDIVKNDAYENAYLLYLPGSRGIKSTIFSHNPL